ncbi:MAG: hypothetical protein U1E76_21435 [Planctomycetota bacterium]
MFDNALQRSLVRLCLVIPLALASTSQHASGQTTHRVSVSSSNEEGDWDSWSGKMSANGRFVVFSSLSTNLVPNDTNSVRDVFVRDRDLNGDGIFDDGAGITVRLSVSSSGNQANGESDVPNISADGRYVTFTSFASNLVPGDANGFSDVFLHDRDPDGNGVFDEGNGVTRRMSVAPDGKGGNGPSAGGAISANGRYVFFWSFAINLVPNDTNLAYDVFVHDRDADGNGIFDEGPGSNTRLSVSSAGVQADADSTLCGITPDGRFACFFSYALNLVPGGPVPQQIYVHDRDPDGNGVFDEGNGRTVQMSLTSAGKQPGGPCTNGAISADGRFVAFNSFATNLDPDDRNISSDVFLHDRDPDGNGVFDEGNATTVRVSLDSQGHEGDGNSFGPALSADGGLVAFTSYARLVPGAPDGSLLLRDVAAGTTSVLSTRSSGQPGTGLSEDPAFSPNGRQVVFTSTARLDGDTTFNKDVFVKDRIALQFHGPAAAGTPVHYTIEHATGETGRLAIVMLSCSGTIGFPLPDGRSVPLTFDSCTVAGFGLIAILSATVDANGSASTPTFTFPSVPPNLPFYSAAVTLDQATGRFLSITGPVETYTQ